VFPRKAQSPAQGSPRTAPAGAKLARGAQYGTGPEGPWGDFMTRFGIARGEEIPAFRGGFLETGAADGHLGSEKTAIRQLLAAFLLLKWDVAESRQGSGEGRAAWAATRPRRTPARRQAGRSQDSAGAPGNHPPTNNGLLLLAYSFACDLFWAHLFGRPSEWSDAESPRPVWAEGARWICGPGRSSIAAAARAALRVPKNAVGASSGGAVFPGSLLPQGAKKKVWGASVK
jgi:hypothetical protein